MTCGVCGASALFSHKLRASPIGHVAFNWLLNLVCNPNVSLWSIPHKRKVLLPMIALGNFTFYSLYGLSIYK